MDNIEKPFGLVVSETKNNLLKIAMESNLHISVLALIFKDLTHTIVENEKIYLQKEIEEMNIKQNENKG